MAVKVEAEASLVAAAREAEEKAAGQAELAIRPVAEEETPLRRNSCIRGSGAGMGQ